MYTNWVGLSNYIFSAIAYQHLAAAINSRTLLWKFLDARAPVSDEIRRADISRVMRGALANRLQELVTARGKGGGVCAIASDDRQM
jgi:hypothetical protein